MTEEELRQAKIALVDQSAPEGSVFIVRPGASSQGFTALSWDKSQESLPVLERGDAIAELFLKAPESRDVDTIVIPGCATSPVGAAAFGKQIANLIDRPVVSIVAGEGELDKWCEVISGGFVMTPLASTLNAFDSFLETVAKVHAATARAWTGELLEAVQEAACLYTLLKSRFLGDRGFGRLNMIVGHSKANWAILIALLKLELELGHAVHLSEEPMPKVHVVTCGNPVDLPDMDDRMSELFRYYQYAGDLDELALTCSLPRFMALAMRADRIDYLGADGYDERADPFDPLQAPAEALFAGCGHPLVRKMRSDGNIEAKPYGLPLNRFIPRIYRAAAARTLRRAA